MPTNHHDLANFIWKIAVLLREPYRPPQYERVMLPMTVLPCFDCVLTPTKENVLREYEKRKGDKLNDEIFVALLAAEAAKLDALRVAAEHTMALLKKRRDAPIAAAVTVLIRVPHLPLLLEQQEGL